MTPLIKFCGLSRPEDIAVANELKPDYIGFVFAKKSTRFVTREKAWQLKQMLDPSIKAVGVFVNENPDVILDLLKNNIIDIAQLHGKEDEAYIKDLKKRTQKPVFKAFSIESEEDIKKAVQSSADMLLFDSKTAGSGTIFDWELIKGVERPYFLAGGLDITNVTGAIKTLSPYGVDVSSGIETGGSKDKEKMTAFERAVRKGI